MEFSCSMGNEKNFDGEEIIEVCFENGFNNTNLLTRLKKVKNIQIWKKLRKIYFVPF